MVLASTLVCALEPPRKLPLRIDESSRIKGLPDKMGKLYALQELGSRNQLPTTVQQPLLVEQNVGQAKAGFKFVVRSASFAAGFSPSGLTTAVVRRPAGHDDDPKVLDAQAFQLVFQSAKPAQLEGKSPVGGKVRIVRGKASKAGNAAHAPPQTASVPSFATVNYRGMYPGVVMAAAGGQGTLKYGFVLEPSAAVGSIRIQVRGSSKLILDSAGNLLMVTPTGTVAQTRPVFTQRDAKGKVQRLKGGFVLLSNNTYGFQVNGRRAGLRLAIDPEIVFQTYFGGSGNEGTLEADGGATDLHGQGFDIAVSSQSNLFVVGTTVSPDFPVTASGRVQVGSDAFVMRLDPSLPPGSQMVYATLVGGSSFERGVALAPRPDHSVYITGCTTSTDFPTTAGVLQPTPGNSVGYVVRLKPDGEFEVGTLLGNNVVHHPASITFSQRSDEADGFVYVAGSVMTPTATSAAETTTTAFQRAFGGGASDGFIAKIDAALTRFEYLTLLGGSGRDLVRDLSVNDGYAFVTGATSSPNFPTTDPAHQRFHSQAGTNTNCANDAFERQCFDAFVTRVGRDGSSLVYSTYHGGSNEEYGRGIAVDANNRATVTGASKPTTGNETQIFVVRFEGGGENLIWETIIPGLNRDHGEEVVVDTLGRAHIVGTVSRDGLSTSEATFHGGASDIFYARFAAADGTQEYFTYLGGSGEDRGFAVAAEGTSVDRFCAFIAGSTTSQDITTISSLAGGESHRGRADLLLAATCDNPAQIDLGSGFQKTVSPQSAAVGSAVVFTITVRNGGDVPAGVTVTDNVPPSMNITGVSGPGCGRTGNIVTCSFNAEPGPTSIDIRATIAATSGCPRTVSNAAVVSAAGRSASATASLQVTCPPLLCGNGRIDTGEQCDSTAGCRSSCTRMVCGDGIVDPGEECDKGVLNSTNGQCTPQCKRQTLEGESCRTGPPCVGGLTCGKRCGVVECDRGINLFGLCLFGDTYLLCDVQSTCMPAAAATYTYTED
jgi:uncharacterized repeat protein (TIGR01451 family)